MPSWIEVIVLAIVQGLTEFIPISSTAHLRIVPALFHWKDPGAAFSAVLQIGTLVAVLWYFWRDIARILNEIRKMRDITIIVSEQVLSFALEIADRLLVIDKGAFIHEDRRENVDTAKIARYLSV